MKFWMVCAMVGTGVTFGALSVAAVPAMSSGAQHEDSTDFASAKDGGAASVTVELTGKDAGLMMAKDSGAMNAAVGLMGKDSGVMMAKDGGSTLAIAPASPMAKDGGVTMGKDSGIMMGKDAGRLAE